jgi:hypothetical protein
VAKGLIYVLGDLKWLQASIRKLEIKVPSPGLSSMRVPVDRPSAENGLELGFGK